MAKLYEPMSYRGFDFRQWRCTAEHGPTGGAWVVSRLVEHESADKAANQFLEELTIAADRIAFVSQCAVFSDFEPMILMLEGQDEPKAFFFRYLHPRKGTGLGFGEKEKGILESLEEYKERGDPFGCMREASNATTFVARFALLCAAIEAIAGEGSPRKTDTEYIKKKILCDERLYKEVFGHGVGLRNLLLHGRSLNFSGTTNLAEVLYEKVVQYFSIHQRVALNENVKNPQRNPIGNLTFFDGWFQAQSENLPVDLVSLCDLAKAEESARSTGLNHEQPFRAQYRRLDEPPY